MSSLLFQIFMTISTFHDLSDMWIIFSQRNTELSLNLVCLLREHMKCIQNLH